jgi:hypothetical protein
VYILWPCLLSAFPHPFPLLVLFMSASYWQKSWKSCLFNSNFSYFTLLCCPNNFPPLKFHFPLSPLSLPSEPSQGTDKKNWTKRIPLLYNAWRRPNPFFLQSSGALKKIHNESLLWISHRVAKFSFFPQWISALDLTQNLQLLNFHF